MKDRNDVATDGTLTDGQIIELYNMRDERAISATDRKYRSYLYTIAFNILSSNEDSEECLNDTYLKVWNSIPPAMPRVLKAFLSKITRNTALDKYDEQTAKKRVPLSACEELSELEGFIGDNAMPSEIEAREIARIVSDFLDSLSDTDFYIFMSRYYFARPIGEIASLLCCSESTVNKEIAAIKRELKEKLMKEGYTL